MQEKLNNKIPSFYGQHFDNVFKNKNVAKNLKKTLKTRFYRKMKNNVYKRLLQLYGQK